ncbi:hypothetical protein PTSG_13167 [Salpingoeca rosetta]|uniref:Ubiquitin-like domain-containing protein n=1 Tax=Salpingoeca rosetta (strain ATCC 50818 / BSB-021) TaxID=946362 RepID=F2UT02_SALR5|nr:uncharacterized protein PTSG_13167 [Salpingoeca rosetta]EGD81261.1 hypothetical protein PTSG_13167 [Salpingoeca rosetta]|eukprot:XP_004987657.1 hypothetical protein PTSG_13167 [Salpingoeca rosetta]
MRVRVVWNDGSRMNLRITAAISTPVGDFCQLAQVQLGAPLPDNAVLSLNGKTPLGHTPATPLSALGICSGDLVYIMCPSTAPPAALASSSSSSTATTTAARATTTTTSRPQQHQQQEARRQQDTALLSTGMDVRPDTTASSSANTRPAATATSRRRRKPVCTLPEPTRRFFEEMQETLSSLDTQLDARGRTMVAAVLAVQLLCQQQGLALVSQDGSVKRTLDDTDVFLAALSARDAEVARLCFAAQAIKEQNRTAHTIHLVLVMMLDSLVVRVSAVRQPSSADGDAKAGCSPHHQLKLGLCLGGPLLRHGLKPSPTADPLSLTIAALCKSFVTPSYFSRTFLDRVVHRCAVTLAAAPPSDSLQGQPQEILDHISSFLPATSKQALCAALSPP